MSTDNDLTIISLGTGTSHGVPMIACDCPVCTSNDPRDRRTRPSIAVRWRDRTILVDTAPELRLQCIRHGITRLDAVLYTHHHADHVVGADDLRRFNWIMKREIPLYAAPQTADAIRRMFPYGFYDEPDSPTSSPRLTLHEISDQPLDLFGLRVTPIPLLHGTMPVLGFRFGAFAYCTDCSLIPEQSMPLLQDLDLLILDALRKTPHPTHFNLEQAVATARRINAKQTRFTHIAHELKHDQTNADLPEGMALGYDGEVLSAKRLSANCR